MVRSNSFGHLHSVMSITLVSCQTNHVWTIERKRKRMPNTSETRNPRKIAKLNKTTHSKIRFGQRARDNHISFLRKRLFRPA